MTAGGTALLRVAPDLEPLLTFRHRGTATGGVVVALDGTSSLLHLVESVGVPRTEIGALRVGEVAVPNTYRPLGGDVIEVLPVRRPQRLGTERFLLDVHLGTLARRMRVLGLDTAYRPDADDPALVAQAIAEGRVLLTCDRGLLRRQALPAGAYVRGQGPSEQLADVLDRFAPRLDPWTRCTACNGSLQAVGIDEVAERLEPGTLRSYTSFARCVACAQVFWRGAHAAGLEAVVAAATRALEAWSTS